MCFKSMGYMGGSASKCVLWTLFLMLFLGVAWSAAFDACDPRMLLIKREDMGRVRKVAREGGVIP